MDILKSILEKYKLKTIEEYKTEYLTVFPDCPENDIEIEYWYMFLRVTDHIPNKIIEAQALGETPEDYTDILNYRQFARDEINRLNGSR